MTRKALSVYMAATCAMMVVAPGRLACGIILAIEICILLFSGTLFRALCRKFKIQSIQQPVVLSSIVFMTIIIRQLIMLFMPLMAMQLGFVIYLPAISTFTTVFLLDEKNYSLPEELKLNMIPALFFAGYCVIVSFIRDILGFGTITLPSAGNQFEYVVFSPDRVSGLTFFATIPGALIMSSLLLAAYLTAEKRFNIIKKAGLDK